MFSVVELVLRRMILLVLILIMRFLFIAGRLVLSSFSLPLLRLALPLPCYVKKLLVKLKLSSVIVLKLRSTHGSGISA